MSLEALSESSFNHYQDTMRLCLAFLVLLKSADGYECPSPPEVVSSLMFSEALLGILQSCAMNGIRTIGLMGLPAELHSLIHSNFFDVISVDYHRMSQDHWKRSQVRLGYIVMSSNQYSKNLDFQRGWWRSADKVIVLHNSSVDKGKELKNVLRELWNRGQLLNVIALCPDPHNAVVAYTFNPYTQFAPDAWIIDEKFYFRPYRIEISGLHSWTTFIYELTRHAETACKIFFFDKTLSVDHYEIYANVKPFPPMMEFNMSSGIVDGLTDLLFTNQARDVKVKPHQWGFVKGFDGVLMATLFTLLNASVNMRIYPAIDKRSERTVTSWSAMDVELKLTSADINLNSRDISYKTNKIAVLYPIFQRDITIVTVKRGTVELPTRLLGIMNLPMVISVVVVSAVMILVLGYFNKRGFVSAALTVLCFILGMGIENLPRNLATRIFLGSLVPYFIIIVATFQGSVTQILTVPLTASNIDSLDDLQAQNHKIYAGYGTSDYFQLFHGSICGLIEHTDEHCTELVLKDPQAACIDDAEFLKYEAMKNSGLHLMKHPLSKISVSYSINPKWPLAKRVERVLFRFKESGLLEKWSQLTHDFRSIRASDPLESKFEAMSLDKCKIFFLFLLVGLGISTIVFLIEIMPFKRMLAADVSNPTLIRGCR